MDQIYVSSRSSAEKLIQEGIRPDKIRLFTRGLHTDLFHPKKRNGLLKKRYHIEEEVKLLYVGRVSKGKNLPILAEAFKSLNAKLKNLHLIVLGDGPYLKEMIRIMRGTQPR